MCSEVNEQKTKVMMVERRRKRKDHPKIFVFQSTSFRVPSFKKLGSMADNTADDIEKIMRRILVSNRAYFSFKKILRSHLIRRKT